MSRSPLLPFFLFFYFWFYFLPQCQKLLDWRREVVSCCDGRGMLRRDDIEVVVVSGFGQDEQFGVGSPFLLR